MTPALAAALTGGLSYPSKMPGPAWNIPASRCLTGSKLRKVPGSTCSKCYALKGRYLFPNVQAALERRLKASDDPRWVEAMVYLIGDTPWFRWFDSGDLQSAAMLARIYEICARTPSTRHWLPTREYALVRAAPPPPSNLNIRLSAYMQDDVVPAKLLRPGVTGSNVSPSRGTCPAPKQGNVCGSCRRCWDRSVANVTYHLH